MREINSSYVSWLTLLYLVYVLCIFFLGKFAKEGFTITKSKL